MSPTNIEVKGQKQAGIKGRSTAWNIYPFFHKNLITYCKNIFTRASLEIQSLKMQTVFLCHRFGRQMGCHCSSRSQQRPWKLGTTIWKHENRMLVVILTFVELYYSNKITKIDNVDCLLHKVLWWSLYLTTWNANWENTCFAKHFMASW